VGQALLVGEYLSFRRVAAVLGIRQSAVSRRVRELEDELGVSLFERHHAGVRITNAGVRFLQEARAALAQLDQAVKAATAAGNEAFWKMQDEILARQWRRFEEPPKNLSSAVLRQVAISIGLDMAVYDYNVATGLSDDEGQQVGQARALLGKGGGRIVIDGEVYGGGSPPHLWRAAIDRALARRR